MSIDTIQESILLPISKWQIDSTAVNFPQSLSSLNTAIPKFSVPRSPTIELVPAVKFSGFISILGVPEISFVSGLFVVCTELLLPELLPPPLELPPPDELPSDSSLAFFSASFLAVAFSPPRIAVESQ